MNAPKLAQLFVANFGAFILALMVLPLMILGPFSLIQVHDNADGVMPLMIVAAENFPSVPGWFRYMASGAPFSAQGIPSGPLTSILQFIPVWPGYLIVFLFQAILGGIGIYLFCKHYLGAQKPIAILLVGLTIFQTEAFLLICAPVMLAPFFSWLVLRFSQSRPTLQKLAIAALGGMALGNLNSSYLVVSFWFLIGPVMIFIGTKKLHESILLAAIFLIGSLFPIAHEVVSLGVNLSSAHRHHNAVAESPSLYELAIVHVSNPFLLAGLFLVFVKDKANLVKKMLALYLLLNAFILTLWLTFDFLTEFDSVASLLKGFNYGRILNPYMFLGLLCGAAFLSSFCSSKHKYLSPLLIIVFLIIPLGNKYTQYLVKSVHLWVVAGNAERFTVPQLENISKNSQSFNEPYRVDMVNFPLGSGFLSAYKLESAGGYLNVYPNRYRNFFADAVTPEISGLPAPSRDSLLKWGNRLNFTCDFIYEGVLAIDECMDMDLVALLNIRYLISRNPMYHENLSLVDGPEGPWNLLTTRQKIQKSVEENFGARESLFIFELKEYAPRAFVVDKIQVASDRKELSDFLKAATLESLLTKAVFLNDDILTLSDNPDGILEDAVNSAPLDAKVTDLQFEDDFFQIKVESNKPGLLIVTNSFAVGWRATVNGEAVGILPAYGAFWGIPVIAGANDVRLEYESYKSAADLLRWLTKYISAN